MVCPKKKEAHIGSHPGLVWYQMKIDLEMVRLHGPFDFTKVTTNNIVT